MAKWYDLGCDGLRDHLFKTTSPTTRWLVAEMATDTYAGKPVWWQILGMDRSLLQRLVDKRLGLGYTMGKEHV